MIGTEGYAHGVSPGLLGDEMLFQPSEDFGVKKPPPLSGKLLESTKVIAFNPDMG
jgi:hypothetical protein